MLRGPHGGGGAEGRPAGDGAQGGGDAEGQPREAGGRCGERAGTAGRGAAERAAPSQGGGAGEAGRPRRLSLRCLSRPGPGGYLAGAELRKPFSLLFLIFYFPPPPPLRMDGPQLVRSTRGGGFSVEVGARARVAALQTESFGRGGGVHTSGLQILGCKGFNDCMRRSVFQNLYKFV